MRPVEESSTPIPLVDSTGREIAGITVLPRKASDTTSPLHLSPLVEAAGPEAEEFSESRYQLIENGRYEYELVGDDLGNLALRESISCKPSRTKATHTGTIEPGLYTGNLLIELVNTSEPDEPIAHTFITVRPAKQNYRDQYREMLRYLSSEMAALIHNFRSPTKLRYRSRMDMSSHPAQIHTQIELLRAWLTSPNFESAFQQLIRNPHELVSEVEEHQPSNRPFRPSGRTIRQLIHGSRRAELQTAHPLRAKSPHLRSIAEKLYLPRKTPTRDTPENRFIKFALEDMQSELDWAEQLFAEKGGKWLEAQRLCGWLRGKLQTHLQNSIFTEIGRAQTLPLGSSVLQRRSGYREILQGWMKFRSSAQLTWNREEEDFQAGSRDVATLYEYWLFFQLYNWAKRRFGVVDDSNVVELDKNDGTLVLQLSSSRPKSAIREKEFSAYGRKLKVRFDFNRTFKAGRRKEEEGSWTRRLRPDYTFSFWPSEMSEAKAEELELMVHIHFDSKYSVASLSELFGNEDSYADDDTEEDLDSEGKTRRRRVGNFKNPDLLKMHAYRDAIRRSEGAYIIYPGSNDVNDQFGGNQEKDISKRWPRVMSGFHELLPGLGAFAVVPGGGDGEEARGMDAFSTFMEDVIENIANRISLRERLSSTRYTQSQRDDLDDTSALVQEMPELYGGNRWDLSNDSILLTWFKTKEQRDWMVDQNKFVVRLDNRPGSLTIDSELTSANFIALWGKAKNTQVPGIWSIKNGFQIWSRETLNIKSGNLFPTSSSNSTDRDLMGIFKVEKLEAHNLLLPNRTKLEDLITRTGEQKNDSQGKAYQLDRSHRGFPKLLPLSGYIGVLTKDD